MSQHMMNPNGPKRRRRHRAVLQASPRKATKEPDKPDCRESKLPHVSLFGASHDTSISGGQFNSLQGYLHNTNQFDNLVNGVTEPLGHTQNPRHNTVMSNEQCTKPMCGFPPLSVRRSCDIYNRCLAAKGRGTPMWLTSPSSTHPVAYQRRGIAVGDVGILTASGGFDFLFNIYLPVDHPINQQGLPEGFSPLSPQLQSNDIHRHRVFNLNSHLTSASVAKSNSENDSSGIMFESSASEGAILTMPHGAHSEDLVDVSRFRQYLSANAESWYRYVNNICGREARNGDVRLVTGCDKASSWGIATFANSTAQDSHLRLQPTGESGYVWEYSGIVEARAGPDPEEMEELRSGDDSGHSRTYVNQCLFVRTLNATLRDDVWQGLGFDFENILEPVHIAALNTTLNPHPSKAMNDFMLSVHPHARIAITEDNDWASLIVESDQYLPPPGNLINRMLTTHDVCDAYGAVFLKLKQMNKPHMPC